MGTLADKELIAAHNDEIVTELNELLRGTGLDPELIHDGVRVAVPMFTTKRHKADTVFVYALPWSRGLSVFTTADVNAGVYNWRDCELVYRGLQRPFYCERGTAGSWNIPPVDVAQAVTKFVGNLQTLSKAREKYDRKAHWPQYVIHSMRRAAALEDIRRSLGR